MNKLENWYKELNKQRKIFVYVVSYALIGLFGFGLIPLLILIYLEFGLPNNNAKKIIWYCVGTPIVVWLAALLFLFAIGEF